MSSAETVVEQQPLPPQQAASESILSPLTGGYLLIVIGEPHSYDHKEIILQKVSKGLLSWNKDDCFIDLFDELDRCSDLKIGGESTKSGERIIQHATKQVIIEVLIHPTLSTLQQCLRNMLSSFTRHRHLIHAGYTFASNGSWILQDGTFSCIDFLEAFQENEVQRVLKAYVNVITIDLHCSSDYGSWKCLPENDRIGKLCKSFDLNGGDRLNSNDPRLLKFMMYVSEFLKPFRLETILEMSDIVGNIRFTYPTLYVFPAGQGDAALFGINGFNMLIDGGFPRKSCFWDFTRHLDRLDAVLMTRINNNNIAGIGAFLKRKTAEHVYPQIGHFFCNLQKNKKQLQSPDGDKDKDPLVVNLFNEGAELVSNIKRLDLEPEPCYSSIEPINLYHKVGHGTLNMYVLNPQKDSKEVREFVQKWLSNDSSLFCSNIRKNSNGTVEYPIQNQVSMSVLLIWLPASSDQKITRLLFPGSTPQAKIFEGIEKLKHLEFLKHQVCRLKDLNIATTATTSSDSRLDTSIVKKSKVTRKDIQVLKSSPVKNGVSTTSAPTKTTVSLEGQLDKATIDNNGVGGMPYEKKVKVKSTSRTSTRQTPEQVEKKAKVTTILSESSVATAKHSSPKKGSSSFASTEKSTSCTTKSATFSGSALNSSKNITTRRSIVHSPTPPSATATLAASRAAVAGTSFSKSTKDATNRKVVESKYLSKRETTTTTGTAMKNDAVMASSRKTLIKKQIGLSATKSKRDSSIAKKGKSVDKQLDNGTETDIKKNLVFAAECVDLAATNVATLPSTFDGESEEYLICSLDHKQQKLNIEILQMKTSIDCSPEQRDFHQNVGLTKDSIKTPDEVADLPIDEEFIESDSVSVSYANDEPKLKSDHLQTEKFDEKNIDAEKGEKSITAITIVDVKENLNMIEERDDDGEGDAADEKDDTQNAYCVIGETHKEIFESTISKTDCEKDDEEIEENNSKQQFYSVEKCQESNDEHQEQQENKTFDRKKSIHELSIKDQLEKALADGKFSLVSSAFKQSSDEHQAAPKNFEKHEIDNTPEFDNKEENEKEKVQIEKSLSIEKNSPKEIRDLMFSSFSEQQQSYSTEDNQSQLEVVNIAGSFSKNLNQDLQQVVLANDNTNMNTKETRLDSSQLKVSQSEDIVIKRSENVKDDTFKKDVKESSELYSPTDFENISEKFNAQQIEDSESELSSQEKVETIRKKSENAVNIPSNLILKNIDTFDDGICANLSDKEKKNSDEKSHDKNTDEQDHGEILTSKKKFSQTSDEEIVEIPKTTTTVFDVIGNQTQDSVENLMDSKSKEKKLDIDESLMRKSLTMSLEETRGEIGENSMTKSSFWSLKSIKSPDESLQEIDDDSTLKAARKMLGNSLNDLDVNTGLVINEGIASKAEKLPTEETENCDLFSLKISNEKYEKTNFQSAKEIPEKSSVSSIGESEEITHEENSVSKLEKTLEKHHVLEKYTQESLQNESIPDMSKSIVLSTVGLENKEICSQTENKCVVPEESAKEQEVFSKNEGPVEINSNEKEIEQISTESKCPALSLNKCLLDDVKNIESASPLNSIEKHGNFAEVHSPSSSSEQFVLENEKDAALEIPSKQTVSNDKTSLNFIETEFSVDEKSTDVLISAFKEMGEHERCGEAENSFDGYKEAVLSSASNETIKQESFVHTQIDTSSSRKCSSHEENDAILLSSKKEDLNLILNENLADENKGAGLISPSKEMIKQEISVAVQSSFSSTEKCLADDGKDAALAITSKNTNKNESSTEIQSTLSSLEKCFIGGEKCSAQTSSLKNLDQQEESAEDSSSILSPNKCSLDDTKDAVFTTSSKETYKQETSIETQKSFSSPEKCLTDDQKDPVLTSPSKDIDKQVELAVDTSSNLSPNKCLPDEAKPDFLIRPSKVLDKPENFSETKSSDSGSNESLVDESKCIGLDSRSKEIEKLEILSETESTLSSTEKCATISIPLKKMDKEEGSTDEKSRSFSSDKCFFDGKKAAVSTSGLKETKIQESSSEYQTSFSSPENCSVSIQKDPALTSPSNTTSKEESSAEVQKSFSSPICLTGEENDVTLRSPLKDIQKLVSSADNQTSTSGSDKFSPNEENNAFSTSSSKETAKQDTSVDAHSTSLSPEKCGGLTSSLQFNIQEVSVSHISPDLTPNKSSLDDKKTAVLTNRSESTDDSENSSNAENRTLFNENKDTSLLSASKSMGKQESQTDVQIQTSSSYESSLKEENDSVSTISSKDIDLQVVSEDDKSSFLSPNKCSLYDEKASVLTGYLEKTDSQENFFESKSPTFIPDKSSLDEKNVTSSSNTSKDEEKQESHTTAQIKTSSPDEYFLDDDKAAIIKHALQAENSLQLSSLNESRSLETTDKSFQIVSENSLQQNCPKIAESQSLCSEVLDEISKNSEAFVQKNASSIYKKNPDYLENPTDLCLSKLYCSPAKSSCDSLSESLEKSLKLGSESSLEDSLETSPETCKIVKSSETSLVIERQKIVSEVELSEKISTDAHTCAISSRISCDSLNDTPKKCECVLSSKISSDSLSGMTNIENAIDKSSIRKRECEDCTETSSAKKAESELDSKHSIVLENMSDIETRKDFDNFDVKEKGHTTFCIETDSTDGEFHFKKSSIETSSAKVNEALESKQGSHDFTDVKTENSKLSTCIISNEAKNLLVEEEKVETIENLSECKENCEYSSFDVEKQEILSMQNTSEKETEPFRECESEMDCHRRETDFKSKSSIKRKISLETFKKAEDAKGDINFQENLQLSPPVEETSADKLNYEKEPESSPVKYSCSEIERNQKSSNILHQKTKEKSHVDVLESDNAELSHEVITKIESYHVDERIESGQTTKTAIEIEKLVSDNDSQMKVNREDQSETRIEHRLDSNRFLQESIDSSRSKQSVLSLCENVVNFDRTISSEHDIETIQLTREKEAISSDHEEIRCTNRTIDNIADGSQAIESSLESYAVRSCDISVMEPNSNRIQKQIIQSDKRQQIHEEVSRSDLNKYQSSTTIQKSSSTHSSTTSSPIHSLDCRRVAVDTTDNTDNEAATPSRFLIEQSGGEYETVQIIADEQNECLSTTIVVESFDIMKIRNEFDSTFDKGYDQEKKCSMPSERLENMKKKMEPNDDFEDNQEDNTDIKKPYVDENLKKWRGLQFDDSTYTESYSYQYEITAAKFTTELGLLNFGGIKTANLDKCVFQEKDEEEEEKQPKSTSSVEVIYSKTDTSELYDDKQAVNLETYWDSKPLGLPISTPTKSPRKTATVASATTSVTYSSKISKASKEGVSSASDPIYVDLTYVPHHGNHEYAYVDFFKRIRARYYVFSGLEPTYEVFNALLEAKISWGMDDFEVTIIPTYDTDILASWVADNEENLVKYKIDLSPSASRCTINLQDHDTSCSAYRLEF